MIRTMIPSIANRQKLSAMLAFAGVLIPGLHKFYLRQWPWGVLYLVLGVTHIPQVASVIEGLWYLMQSQEAFDRNFQVAKSATVMANHKTEAHSPDPSLEHSSSVVPSLPPIDVNRARVEDWQTLPGISADQAQLLAEFTQAGIPFHSLEDVAAALNVPTQHLLPLEPMLRFYYYGDVDPEPNLSDLSSSNPVSLNTASIEKLAHVPGIDSELANAIVQERMIQGDYRNLADLKQRLSLPATLVGDLMYHLYC